MDATEIAMEERVKLDDRVASTMLQASASTTSNTESGGIAQELSGAEVSHPHFLNSQLSCPYCIYARLEWTSLMSLPRPD